MKEYIEFRKKTDGTDLDKFRSNFVDNYTSIENYCKAEFGRKFRVLLLSDKINFAENKAIIENIKDLIKLEYIKSNDFNFQVTPDVKNATDFLRLKLLNIESEFTFQYSESRAIFYLLEQVRNNLIHHGKFELEDEQFQRNYDIIKAVSNISDEIIQMLNK